MAWYRAGGGGIPSSLKTGMDSVLNKKFGTSTTYPAEDWPDTVNLMGPLPEKTVSGAIATFADGADTVPLKKCEITLPASLDGYSSVDVKHTEKNLLNDSIRGNNGANIYFGHDTGTQIDFSLRLIAGTYTFSVVTADGTVTNLYVKNSDTNTNITGFPAYATLSKTFTLEEDTNCAVYVYKQDYTDVTDIISAQIEVGSSATTYEPYTAPTTHTASLGRTIYGGTADVVNGQGIGECVKVKFSDLTWFTNLLNGARQFYAVLSDSKTPINNNTILDGLMCDDYNVTYANDVYLDTSVGDKISINTGNALQVRDYSVTTLEDFIAKTANYELVYPLATPETFTFDPVSMDSKLGNNTLWSEQGSDTEVTYRADINLALGGN